MPNWDEDIVEGSQIDNVIPFKAPEDIKVIGRKELVFQTITCDVENGKDYVDILEKVYRWIYE